MNELSLFTGAGGGLLGTKLLGWKAIGYVEKEPYCQKVIRQRIADGILDAAPIFTDIRDFISGGYAESYQGMVDVLSAGFPCQPFSVAGQQRGADDPRNMWPQTIECIRIIRPRIAFLENVPGLLANEYIRTIFGDLAEAGYHARWCVLGADDCGCCHRRKRVWIVAYSEHDGGNKTKTDREYNQAQPGESCDSAAITGNQDVADTGQFTEGNTSERFSKKPFDCNQENIWPSEGDRFANGSFNDEQLHGCDGEWFESWFEVATRLCRVDDEVASRVDRLKACGNGQVSIVAAAAFKILTRDLMAEQWG